MYFREHIEKVYIGTRYNIQKDLWQLLYPKHFVNVLLIHHIQDNREREIHKIAKLMQYGLTLGETNLPYDDYYSCNSNTVDLMEFFVTHSESKQSSKCIKTNMISDIFLPFQNNDGSTNVPRFVLIEGAPGMGKTTLCKEMACMWVNGCLLKDAKLVLLVYLRDPDILKIKNLTDLFHYFYHFGEEAKELSKQCAQAVITRDSSDITLILDGYDELHESKQSLINKILNRNVLPQCRIVVTSRLTASDRLHRIADVRVEILGFTDESKIQYINQELKGYPDKIQKMQIYLNDHGSIKSICYIPIMMTILVYLFKMKGELPSNPTEIYEKFIALTISYHLNKQNEPEKEKLELCVSLQSLSDDHKRYLVDLSNFAFLTLQSDQKVFNIEDIKKWCPNSTLANTSLENLGLISSVQYFCGDKGSSHVFNFLHLSIHEYLAAYYISCIDQCSQFNELNTTFFIESYKYTWIKFIALNRKSCLAFQNYSIYCKDTHYEALSNWTAELKCFSLFQSFVMLCNNIACTNTITSDHIQLLLYHDKTDYLFQIQIYISYCHVKLRLLELYIFETDITINWYEIGYELVNDKSGTFVCIRNGEMLGLMANEQQLIKCFALKVSFSKISLQNCYITIKTLGAMILHLKSICYLQHFELITCTFEPNGFVRLADTLSGLSTIKTLKIHSSIFTDEDANALVSLIARLSNASLQILDFSKNYLECHITRLIESLSKNVALTQITIRNIDNTNNMSQSIMDLCLNIVVMTLCLFNTTIMISIMQLFCNFSSFQVLDVSNNQFTKEGLTSVVLYNTGLEDLGEGLLNIMKAQQHVTSLRILCLITINISREVPGKLALAIKLNKHLQELWLHNNNSKSLAVAILQSLSTISTLKLLNINNNQISEEAGEALASVIMNNKGLEELHLSGNNLDEGMLTVTKALQHLSSLRSLDLGNNNISKEVSDELALAIKANEQLEKIRLYGSSLKASAIVLLQSLSTISTLKLLNIRDNEITEEAGEALASVVMHNTGLEELRLDGNSFGEGLFNVMKALQSITSLKMLILGNSDISKKVSCELAVAIKSNNHLEKLGLYNSNMKSSAFAVIQALSTISTLKLLNISDNQITEEAGEALASVVMHNTGLEELRLDGNSFGEGLFNVMKALQSITSLRILSLGNSDISKKVSCELAVAIKSNNHLEKLGLYNSNMKSSAFAVIQALSTISTLKYLNINDNQITEEAGEALASVVMHNTGLEELHLGGNNLGEGMLIVAKALQHISMLKSLDLGNNNISKEVSDELALAIKANEQLEEMRLYGSSLKASVIVLLQSLSTISTLKLLNISDNQITEEAGEALASVVMHNTGLEELRLDGNSFGEGLFNVMKALQSITSLRLLDLFNSDISKKVSCELAVAIKSNNHLEKLWLYNSNMKSSAFAVIQALSTISTLKYLNINDNQITEEAGEALASVVMHNTGLEELHLGGNNLGEGMLIVAKALQHISMLKSLDLGNNNISKEVSDELALAIKANEQLEEMRLYGSSLKASVIVLLQSLSTISTLKLLNISDNQITEEAGEALASVVMHNTGLEELRLDGNSFGEGLFNVMKALQSITSLRLLDLFNSNISKKVSCELAVAIKSNNHLEKLWLYNSNMKSSAFAVIQALSTISTLKYLNINNNQITEEAGEALASVVMHNTGLEELRLDGNSFGEGLFNVMKALQSITSLRILSLGNSDIFKKVSCELAVAIKSNNHLEKLGLYNSNMKSSSFAVIQALSTISTLKYLNINNNQITEEAGEELASVVMHNTGLEELHLDSNSFGEGLFNVMKALQSITSLRKLHLGNSDISKKVSCELAVAIKSNNHLEKLWLCNSNMKSSAFAVIQALSTISTLKYLNINNNQITEEAGEALASVVMHNTGLEELHLSGNNLGEGMLIVAKALQHISKLKSLDLGNNNISKEVSDELALAIKANEQLEEMRLYGSSLKASVIVLLQSLSTISTLKLLNISDNQITEEAGEALASVVMHNTGLEELRLDGNSFGEGLFNVMKDLQSITSLKMLILGNSDISKKVSCELAVAIKSNNHLEKLGLYNSNMKSSSFAVIQALSTISTLKYLNINNNQITEEAGEELASVVMHNTGLEELHLDSNSFGEGLFNVMKALQSITSLRKLHLGNSDISKKVSCELAVAIKSNNHLEKLWLCNSNMKSSAFAVIQALSTISTLKYLNINNNQITEEAGEALASVVMHNTGLEELHLSGNNLGEGMLIVAKALQHISKLKSLDLGNNNISKEVSDELALAIKANEQLEEMRLYGSSLKASAIVLLQSLSTISTLKLLIISDNQITEEAGEALASVVMHNTGLEELHLDGNSFGEGLFNVMKALQSITSLRKLYLGNSDISKKVSCELAVAIKSNNHLEKLWLCNSNMKSSAFAVIQALSTISTLKYLNINNNQITEEAGEALASVVMHNTGLEELHLSGNNLGEGMLIVAKALQHISKLKSLDLGNNNISKEVSDELALAIKANEQLEEMRLYGSSLKASAIVLLQSLSTISTLKLLIISDNQITEEAGEALASVVMHNTGLEELHLSGNNLGEGMLIVAKALQHISKLKSLDLGIRRITSRW